MSDKFEQQFLELQQIFIGNLTERKQRIDEFYVQFSASGLAQNILVNLHREVHNLTGAAGCYKLTSLAEESRKLEDHLQVGLNKARDLTEDQQWQASLSLQLPSLTQLIDKLTLAKANA